MKKRGRGERYVGVQEGEKRQYPGGGVEERRKRTGKGKREKKDSMVMGRRKGSVVWPTLTEGYVMKERNKTGAKQYARTYALGRTEFQTTKRPVGRKRVMGVLGRPSKERVTSQEDQQNLGCMVWDRVERQRKRAYWEQKGGRDPHKRGASMGYGGEEREQRKTERRGWKRRRRRCERARNLYEYSTRRRVEEGSREKWSYGGPKGEGSEGIEGKVGREARRYEYGIDSRGYREWHREDLAVRESRRNDTERRLESGEVKQRRAMSEGTWEGGRSQRNMRTVEV